MPTQAHLSALEGLIERLLASPKPCVVIALRCSADLSPQSLASEAECQANAMWQKAFPATGRQHLPLQDLLDSTFESESAELALQMLGRKDTPSRKSLPPSKCGSKLFVEFVGDFCDAETDHQSSLVLIESDAIPPELAPATQLPTHEVALESLIEGRAIIDQTGLIISCNSPFGTMMELESLTPEIEIEKLIPSFGLSKSEHSTQSKTACTYSGRRFSVDYKTMPIEGSYALVSVVDLSQQTLFKNRMRAAVEGANIGLWEIDLETGRVNVSPELLSQLGESDSWSSLADFDSRVHPQDREHFMSAFAQAINDPEQSYEQIVRLRHVDGEYRHILTKGQFYNDPEKMGGAIKAFGMHLDISNQVKTEQDLKHYTKQLEKRNEELDSFAHAASHDLRAPVRTIRYLVDWIESDCQETLTETSLGHFSNLKTRLNRMDRLLVDLLAYSRIGRCDLQREEIDCRKVIQEICDDEIDSKLFEFEISEFMPAFETSATPLKQVLRNLISNAIKHHPKTAKHRRDNTLPDTPGKITVSCAPDDRFFKFAVSDDGNGIPEKYHEKIFEFFQTLQSRDEVEGSGLGLSMVRKAIESQGGEISVSSAEGCGTTFTFTWPKA